MEDEAEPGRGRVGMTRDSYTRKTASRRGNGKG